ncbi:MAG TPA: MBL fold metallo-hydrolase [Polyangiales bacterium]|nr:MBL fold metallo-hydrolase [Polyangiales bacterium]
MNKAKAERLERSTDMVPVDASVEVDIPAAELWDAFNHARLWPTWNKCFLMVGNDTLRLGDKLVWVFAPIKPYYPYVMPAVANIIELEPGRKVTWEVTAMPGFYAHHTYSVEAISATRSRFRSWEKAYGPSFRAMESFWLSHFWFVNRLSLEGARTLEREYRRFGNLGSLTHAPGLGSRVRQGLLTASAVAGPVWFYDAYIKQSAEQLAPGVHAVIGGGGNTLIVEDAGKALLVDTKFPPGSDVLARWVRKHVKSPIQYIVNTHYHYDHAQGNELYPEARIVAHHSVPELMIAQEGEYWSRHYAGLPSELIPDAGQRLQLGNTEIVLRHLGTGHTHGDLIAYLPAHDVLATGDLFFHTYYPFFDLSKAGVSLSGLIRAIDILVKDYAGARVVPGHGPLASTEDLARYAQYLRELRDRVAGCIARGESEDHAVASIELPKRRVLPSFHDRRVSWATRETNIRAAYRLLKAEPSAQPVTRPRTIRPKDTTERMS